MKTGYPSIDKPWLKYYRQEVIQEKLPEQTIFESIYSANREYPNDPALDYYGIKLTYGELFENIQSVAESLTAIKVAPKDIVTICMINSPESVYLLYAINRIGAIANMISGLSEPEEIIKYINDVQSTVIFVLDVFMPKIRAIIDHTSLKRIVVISSAPSTGNCDIQTWKDCRVIAWDQFKEERCILNEYKKSPDDTAVITYTGGTTGSSKGVMLCDRSILASAQQYLWCETAIQRRQTWLQTIPLYVAFGVVSSLQLPFMAGQELLLRTPLAQSLTELFEQKPNHVLFGPVQWEQLADDNRKMDLSFLIEPTSGGDKLALPVEEKICAYLAENNSRYPLMNGYGMSEVSAGVASNFMLAHRIGSIGVPYCKNVIAAFDQETGMECKYGEEGEICICTPSMMSGYVNNPEETNHVIRVHQDGSKWVHTGDLGYVSEDGFVYISGRIKRYFLYIEKNEQKKVFCINIENALLKHPDVENCTVVPMPDKKHYQVAVACIKLKDNSFDPQTVEESLDAFCKENMDARACPKIYLFMNDFPRTSLGKIDFRKLEEMISGMMI